MLNIGTIKLVVSLLFNKLMFLDLPKENNNILFKYKMQTDLFEFIKSKTSPRGLGLSHDGRYMAIIGKDRILRLYNFQTGKIIWRIYESIQAHMMTQASL